jgi:hypothetical protein
MISCMVNLEVKLSLCTALRHMGSGGINPPLHYIEVCDSRRGLFTL